MKLYPKLIRPSGAYLRDRSKLTKDRESATLLPTQGLGGPRKHDLPTRALV